jgi:cell division protein ZapE
VRPAKKYQLLLQESKLHYDAGQEVIVGHLDALHMELSQYSKRPGLLQWLLKRESPRGLYIWGGVGRGKTHLMDMFYESIEGRLRLRLHFHRFMQKIHASLTRYSGTKNPLKKVAADVAKNTEVLCFDDFFVEEIGDAMLLGELLKELFARGVCLVITSNIAPENLYENGLQRARFMPAIRLLQKHCRELRMDFGPDYRLQTLKNNKLYHCPADKAADRNMQREFMMLAPEKGSRGEIIEVEGRELWTRQRADDVVWFNFSDLCGGPRNQNDYIHLALEFHAILLSNVPQMTAEQDSAAKRFIYLIDVLYDHRVKLIVSAANPPHELYQGTQLRDTFVRTSSRLIEMQSMEYLSSRHLSRTNEPDRDQ